MKFQYFPITIIAIIIRHKYKTNLSNRPSSIRASQIIQKLIVIPGDPRNYHIRRSFFHSTDRLRETRVLQITLAITAFRRQISHEDTTAGGGINLVKLLDNCIVHLSRICRCAIGTQASHPSVFRKETARLSKV